MTSADSHSRSQGLGRDGITEAADGTILAYRTSGDGPALLLVHSAAADARQWQRLVPLLSPAFTVVTMDRRGRGASGPISADHSLAIEYGDVAAVAAAIGGPVHLVGHSSGARYALHAARQIPALASLALYEPPEREQIPDSVVEALAGLESAGDRVGVLRAFFVDILGLDDESFSGLQARPIWDLMVDNALTLPAEIRAAREYRFDPTEFAALDVPTLLLVGELSDPDVRQVVDRLADALPRAKVVTLAGQGHGAMFSAPQLLASALSDFFDALG